MKHTVADQFVDRRAGSKAGYALDTNCAEDARLQLALNKMEQGRVTDLEETSSVGSIVVDQAAAEVEIALTTPNVSHGVQSGVSLRWLVSS